MGVLGQQPTCEHEDAQGITGAHTVPIPDEIDRLLNACRAGNTESVLAHAYLKPFVIIALNTGMRRNEMLGLTRAAVDWQNRMVPLGITKNGTRATSI